MRPYIIAFVGTVGSGKSTQMRLLAFKLKMNGQKVKVTFLKSGHLFAYILEVILVKILIKKRKNKYPIRALIEERSSFFKRLFKLWLYLDLMSISIHFLLSVYIPKKMRFIVLVEEYFSATIADYIYLAKVVGLPLSSISFAVKFVLKLLKLGGPVHIVFLDAKDATLKERWNQRASLDEKLDYLQMQRSLLLSISEKLSSLFFYIDTNNQYEMETHQQIVNYLMNFC